VAWVSLDEGDNDTARFWSYIAAAVQKIRPDGDFTLHAGHAIFT